MVKEQGKESIKMKELKSLKVEGRNWSNDEIVTASSMNEVKEKAIVVAENRLLVHNS